MHYGRESVGLGTYLDRIADEPSAHGPIYRVRKINARRRDERASDHAHCRNDEFCVESSAGVVVDATDLVQLGGYVLLPNE